MAFTSRDGLTTGHPGGSSSLDLGAFLTTLCGDIWDQVTRVASDAECAATSIWLRVT